MPCTVLSCSRFDSSARRLRLFYRLPYLSAEIRLQFLTLQLRSSRSRKHRVHSHLFLVLLDHSLFHQVAFLAEYLNLAVPRLTLVKLFIRSARHPLRSFTSGSYRVYRSNVRAASSNPTALREQLALYSGAITRAPAVCSGGADET